MCVCVQGECRYEQELLPYLHKADGHVKTGQKKQKSTKTCTKTTNSKPKPPHSMLSDLGWIDEEAEGENTRGASLVPALAVTKQRLPVQHDTEASYGDITDHPGPEAICPPPSNNDCPEVDIDDDCTIIDEDVIKSERTVGVDLDKISQLITKIDEDEDVELQAMFYLPKWGPAPPPSSAKLPPGRDQSLKVILANVAELLSTSPPSLTEDLEADVAAPSLPPSPHQPFKVSFTLDVDDNDDDDDDDDDEVIISDADDVSPRANSDEPPVGKEDSKIYHNWPHQEPQAVSRGSTAADSPTWDEVFGEEELNDNHDFKEERAGEEGEKHEEIKSKNDGMTEGIESCWDDVRNEDLRDGGVKDDRDSHTDESMDLFGDDEAFLQMTIPDISTPGVTPRTSPSAGDTANSRKKMSNTLHIHTPTNTCNTTHTAESAHSLNTAHADDLVRTKLLTPHAKLINQDTNTQSTAETRHNTHSAAQSKHVTDNSMAAHCKSPTVQQPFDSSHDYFSVNFDLGYSLEDSEEEEEEVEDVVAPCMPASPRPKKQAVSNSSTPYNNFHRQRMPLQSSKSKLSTPRVLSEHRKRDASSLLASPFTSKGGALPSPITSPGARRTLMPCYGGPHSPSLPPRSKRLEGRTAEAERGSGVENSSRQESVCVADSPPHPGLFTHQKI